jgi:GTP-binding protein
MKFIDEANITVSSGNGGHGSRHFRREKFAPLGGPDGGDGGGGGDVVLVASTRSRSLLTYHHRRIYKAGNGLPGSGSKSTGKSGPSLELVVPVGTQVLVEDSGELLGDLTDEGQRLVVAKGGNGGWGNFRFRSSTQQAPDRANPGAPGETRPLKLELKLLADVGLVGLPNAGKSTLIRRISASRARVADYPFTTLVPNLGVVNHGGTVFTVADVPGLIEGAADGAGLGTRFLRHVERCAVLVLLLSAVDEVPAEQAWAVLRDELSRFNPELLERASIVTLSKADMLGPDAAGVAAELGEAIGVPVLPLSGLSGDGIRAFLDQLATLVNPVVDDHDTSWDPMA